jgi:mono/diheme cytochrome c family protein
MRAPLRAVIAAVLLLLALPGAASAGGFATVGLSSLPDGTAPGRPWHVTLTILQHGRTPLPGLQPVVRIRSGAAARTFPARPDRRPGVYTADVVFPAAGTWRYAIDDGFSQRHDFAPVRIGTVATTTTERDANVGAALAAAALAGLLGALLAAALRRRLYVAGPAAAAVALAVVLVATGRGETTTTTTAAAAAPAARGRAVFARMGCGSCHALSAAGSRGVIGPSLDAALPGHTPTSLKAKITRPGLGSVMPQDFARRMDATELAALVDFLMAAGRAS